MNISPYLIFHPNEKHFPISIDALKKYVGPNIAEYPVKKSARLNLCKLHDSEIYKHENTYILYYYKSDSYYVKHTIIIDENFIILDGISYKRNLFYMFGNKVHIYVSEGSHFMFYFPTNMISKSCKLYCFRDSNKVLSNIVEFDQKIMFKIVKSPEFMISHNNAKIIILILLGFILQFYI